MTGVLLGILVTAGAAANVRTPLILAGAVVLAAALGRADDRGRLGPAMKWGLQTALLLGAAVLLLPSTTVPWLSGLFLAALVLSLLVQTALEIFDNMDGALALAGSAGFLALYAAFSDSSLRSAAGAACGATLGFLLWNRPPARLFLGNAGSYPLSLLLSVLVLASLVGVGVEGRPRLPGQPEESMGRAWPVLLPLLWPLFDLAYVSVSRIGRGKRPWEGGRDHTTHALSRHLGSDRAAVVLLLAVSVAAVAVARVLLGGRP